MNDSRKVANAFLEIAGRSQDTLTPMQLLKLTYIAHGWMLGLYGRPLVCDEVQAWQYGPVIPRLYDAIKGYRSRPVDKRISGACTNAFGEREQSVIEQTFGIYGKMPGPALSRITHAEGTPWELTYEPDTFGLVIPDDLIQDHYAMLANAGD